MTASPSLRGVRVFVAVGGTGVSVGGGRVLVSGRRGRFDVGRRVRRGERRCVRFRRRHRGSRVLVGVRDGVSVGVKVSVGVNVGVNVRVWSARR
ncbi:MAG: hypothetical protein IPK17_39345 [Chloroflexi bacterium]|uniref:hypothetical protein n=1 Tax=Candidatus Flexifilum breve TaxID=3140694 RepID=UPI0031362C73|nr:hypothetical protein [Chloroflexota bacterium]